MTGFDCAMREFAVADKMIAMAAFCERLTIIRTGGLQLRLLGNSLMWVCKRGDYGALKYGSTANLFASAFARLAL